MSRVQFNKSNILSSLDGDIQIAQFTFFVGNLVVTIESSLGGIKYLDNGYAFAVWSAEGNLLKLSEGNNMDILQEIHDNYHLCGNLEDRLKSQILLILEELME